MSRPDRVSCHAFSGRTCALVIQSTYADASLPSAISALETSGLVQQRHFEERAERALGSAPLKTQAKHVKTLPQKAAVKAFAIDVVATGAQRLLDDTHREVPLQRAIGSGHGAIALQGTLVFGNQRMQAMTWMWDNLGLGHQHGGQRLPKGAPLAKLASAAPVSLTPTHWPAQAAAHAAHGDQDAPRVKGQGPGPPAGLRTRAQRCAGFPQAPPCWTHARRQPVEPRCGSGLLESRLTQRVGLWLRSANTSLSPAVYCLTDDALKELANTQ